MEQTVLKKIRLIYPGILTALLITAYIFKNDITSVEKIIKNSNSIEIENIVPIIFVLLFGITYYAIGVRNIIWGPAMKKVGDNINRSLLAIAGVDPQTPLTSEQKCSLKDSVFYYFIDNDASLTIKSLNVKQNGCILSCTVDTFLFLTSFIIILAIESAVKHMQLGFLFWIAACIDLISVPIFFLLLKNHILLSNQQIGVIKTNYKKECKAKILKIIR